MFHSMGFGGEFPLVFSHIWSWLARATQALFAPGEARMQLYVDDPALVAKGPHAKSTLGACRPLLGRPRARSGVGQGRELTAGARQQVGVEFEPVASGVVEARIPPEYADSVREALRPSPRTTALAAWATRAAPSERRHVSRSVPRRRSPFAGNLCGRPWQTAHEFSSRAPKRLQDVCLSYASGKPGCGSWRCWTAHSCRCAGSLPKPIGGPRDGSTDDGVGCEPTGYWGRLVP